MPYSSLATGVLPVNVIFLTVLCEHISRPTSETFFSVVMTFMTPGGTPARAPNYAGSVQISFECGTVKIGRFEPQPARAQRRVFLQRA